MNNKDTGELGENMAAVYLGNNGFNILERNWRFKHLEIDIIASKYDILHIVEVKTRTDIEYGYPEQMIGHLKMQFLKNAAAHYHYEHPEWKWLQFDIIAIMKKPTDEWALDYFEDVYF